MKAKTTLQRFITAWQNKDIDKMMHYTSEHCKNDANKDRYIAWCDDFGIIKAINYKEMCIDVVATVKVDINGLKWHFTLTKESGLRKTDINGRWGLNPASMRRVN